MKNVKIKKSFFIFLAIIAAILFVLPVTSCSSNDEDDPYVKYFDAEFHRGGRDSYPENSLYAYTNAIEQGATTIEADMQMTKDGVIVMSHNPTLNPDTTRDENGDYVKKDQIDIRTTNYEELKKYDIGHMNPRSEYYQEHGIDQKQRFCTIPTLEQLFQLIQDSGNEEIMVNLETKLYPDPATGAYHKNNVDANNFVKAVNEIVKKYDMENRTIIQSFDWSSLVCVKQINPKLKTAALYSDQPSEDQGIGTLWKNQQEASPWLAGLNIHNEQNDPVVAAHKLGFDIISPEQTEITQEQIEEAHKFGMKVVVWTVDKEEDMEKAYNMGVDGIISDKGELLRSFLEKKGAPLAPKHTFTHLYTYDM